MSTPPDQELPPPKTLTFQLSDGKDLVVQVQECPYESGGLGCRVWGAAHLLAAELAKDPSSVAGLSVLELGAGCGLAGLAAAALGARTVALTDALPGLLHALARGARLQAAEEPAGPPEGGEPWDFTSRSGCEIRVRRLYWEDEPSGPGGRGELGEPGALASTPPPHARTMLRDQLKRAPPCGCPALAPGEAFDVVLGADLLYDSLQLEPLARAVANRLAPGGECRMVLTIRERGLLAALLEQLEEAGLEAQSADAGALPDMYLADILADDEVSIVRLTATWPGDGRAGASSEADSDS